MRTPMFNRALLFALTVAFAPALPAVWAAFSSVAANAGNSFQAASCFPDTLNGTIARDAYVDQALTTQNFGTANTVEVWAGNLQARRVLVKFTGPTEPASACTVQSAVLKLWVSTYPGQARTYNAYRITADWTETAVTWTNQPSTDATAYATSVPASGSAAYLEFNVVEIARDWYDDDPAATNYGILVRDSNEGGVVPVKTIFEAREPGTNPPQLVVAFQ